MIKLLTAFKTNPTLENATKLYRYDQKHPMAAALLTPDQSNVLRLAANSYRKDVIRQSMIRSLNA